MDGYQNSATLFPLSKVRTPPELNELFNHFLLAASDATPISRATVIVATNSSMAIVVAVTATAVPPATLRKLMNVDGDTRLNPAMTNSVTLSSGFPATLPDGSILLTGSSSAYKYLCKLGGSKESPS